MKVQSTDLLFKGRACKERGLLEESKDYFAQCLASSWSEGDFQVMATAVNEIGNLHILEGKYQEAREYFDKAIALARRTRQTGLLGSLLKDMGNLNALLGRFQTRSERVSAQFREVEREYKWKRAASLYHELGMTFRRKDRLEEAAGFYSRSARMARRAGDEELLFKSSVALSSILANTGKWVQARRFSRRAFQIAGKLGSDAKLARALLTFAQVERQRGEKESARKALMKALSLQSAQERPELLAEINGELGVLCESTGMWHSALLFTSKAHRILEDLSFETQEPHHGDRLGEIEANFFRLAHTIGQIVEMRCMLAAGHSERVARLGLELARLLGLPSDEEKTIFMAGFLHDLGKVKVRRDVLTGKGRLSDEKLALLRNHPSWGCELLEEVEFVWGVRELILSHHERSDGSGYPLGLQGEEIPVGARILAIADVYDILTSPRHERRANTGAEVLAVMEEDMQGKFDAELFDAFKKMITERLVVLRESESSLPGQLRILRREDGSVKAG